jgi:hypothetical protein
MTSPNTLAATTKLNPHPHPTDCTLSAIARAVSAKVAPNKSILNKNQHDNYTMPIRRNKGQHTKLLLIPGIILPEPTSKPDSMGTHPTTKMCLPITVRIRNPVPSRHHEYDHHRIIKALLHAFQHVAPECNVRASMASKHHDNIKKFLHDTIEIPTTNTDQKEYLEISDDIQTDNFCARILINSNYDLQHFKRNTVFVNWLKDEQIQLDRNPLRNTLRPHQIGFFSHMIPRPDQTELYEIRSQYSVSRECPPFFLQVKHIKAAFGITKVWNIYAHSKDTDSITKELKIAYNKPNLRQFFTWKEYQSLHNTQQLTILKLHNTFINEYRSLLIHGFNPEENSEHVMWDDDVNIQQTTDTEGNLTGKWEFHLDTDDVVMSHETIEERFHQNINLTTTTISEFIQKTFISGDQTPVFAHVYTPIFGTREVLVPNHHIPEALELIKVIKIDLCRIMNHRAIITNLLDFDDIILSTTTVDCWRPFDIQMSIEKSANYHNKPHANKHYKRPRIPPIPWNSAQRYYANNDTTIHSVNDNNNELGLDPTRSTTSTITTISNSTGPHSKYDNNNLGYPVSPSSNNITIHSDIKLIQESLKMLTNQVTENKIDQHREMEQLETRCNQRIQTSSEEQLTRIQDTNQIFLQKMQQDQNSNISLLRSIIEDRESSMEKQMQANFQAILCKLNCSSISPTRKKSNPTPSSDDTHQDVPMSDNDSSDTNTNTTEIFNPYHKTAMQRRSGQNPLPAILP